MRRVFGRRMRRRARRCLAALVVLVVCAWALVITLQRETDPHRGGATPIYHSEGEHVLPMNGHEPQTTMSARCANAPARVRCRSHCAALWDAENQPAPRRSQFELKADKPTPGSADLCFLTETPLASAIEMLERHRIPIVEGPVQKTGAQGPIHSVYVRDPDRNLIEISNAR
jgi:hypothetical protein